MAKVGGGNCNKHHPGLGKGVKAQHTQHMHTQHMHTHQKNKQK